MSLCRDNLSCGNHIMAFPANGIAGVAVFGTGRIFFVARGRAERKIVVIGIDIVGFHAADITFSLFVAICFFL